MRKMPPWTEKRIEWYQRAVAWNRFDRVLADHICRFINEGETVCDMGCGTGYVAMELARRGYETTAFDMNEVTMAYLRQEVPARGLQDKLSLIEGSWDDLDVEGMWDNVVMVFAGHMDKELEKFIRFCRKRLIVIIRESRKSHVQASGITPQIHTKPADIEKVLRCRRYEMVPVVTEFGQPLESMEEAVEYLKTFGADTESEKSALKNIIRCFDSEYTYFLPNEKKMRMYVIER
ncbi:MAG: methyltransferase domain-containing protein [Firmicutes bacterium]|nr:methyltransferase domain-containing protein [Bacillota bacterium]